MKDRLAAPEATDAEDVDQRLDRGVIGGAEQAALSQCLAGQPVADCHPPGSSARSNASSGDPSTPLGHPALIAIVRGAKRRWDRQVVSSRGGYGSLPVMRRGQPREVPPLRLLRDLSRA